MGYNEQHCATSLTIYYIVTGVESRYSEVVGPVEVDVHSELLFKRAVPIIEGCTRIMCYNILAGKFNTYNMELCQIS